MPQTLMPGAILSMPAEAIDRLLKSDSGDGALLYLYLLRHGDFQGLGWESGRLQRALEILQGLEMAPQSQSAPAPAANPVANPAPVPVEPAVPSYSQEEVSLALGESGSPFTQIADEVERQLGKKLNATDLKMLYTLYDHLMLPPEVILLLTTYCVEEHQRKYGQGRKPFVSAVKREGFHWAKKGIETAERAEEFLKKQSLLRSREGRILAQLDIAPRPLVSQEEKYIVQWQEMGFPDEVIRLAYEKTVMKKGGLDWNYITGILRNWHSKNLHSLEAVQQGDKSAAPRGQVGFRPQTGTAGAPSPQMQNQQTEKARGEIQQMRRLMEQMKREEG